MNEISISEAVKILRSKHKNIAFIDVRKREKYVQGFAFGSINCEVAKFNENIIDLVPNNKTIILLIGIGNVTNKKKYLKYLKNLTLKVILQLKETIRHGLKINYHFGKENIPFLRLLVNG